MEVVQILLRIGIDVNAKDKRGDVAAVDCVLQRNVDMLRVLIDEGDGMDIDASNPRGKTLTMQAASYSASCLQLLLQYAPDLHRRTHQPDFQPEQDGLTALHFAVADTYCSTLGRVQMLVEAGAPIDAVDAQGWTPLMLAAWNGQSDIVSYLIGRGADVRAENHERKTAAMLATENGQQSVVQLLAAQPLDDQLRM